MMKLGQIPKISPRLGLEHWESLTVADALHTQPIQTAGLIKTPKGVWSRQVPKVACSSIRLAMCKLEDPELAAKLEEGLRSKDVQEYAEAMTHLHSRIIDEEGCPDPDTSEVVSLFRDPVDRLVSAYQYYVKYPDGVITRGLSFNQFLVFVSRQNPWQTDIHLRPQIFGMYPHTELFPLTKKGIAAFSKRTGLKLPKVNTTDGMEVSDTQRAFINRLYRADREIYDRLLKEEEAAATVKTK